ncbi:shikimate kinase [Paenibacillus sp. 1P07SE]|uniref:shikimate kinase n=1 Tax=Paenibacillus sp. 1P07SE TaxID=3132209 RepID=UPI0039A602B4
MTREYRSIVLVGFMGTGKSSVSRLLAERLGCTRVDLDEAIERREDCTISELFARQGEEAFRTIETDVLADIMNRDTRQVIATGGGAVLKEENRSLMLNNGWVVALTADAERIIARVQSDSARPLLQGDVRQRVNELLERRKHAYDFADLKLDTSRLGVADVAERIIDAWQQLTAAKSAAREPGGNQ